MSQFLRDKVISNVTLDKDALTEIYYLLNRRATALTALAQDENESVFVFAIIRFDGKGYRVHSVDELLHYFIGAKTVERIFLVLQNSRALGSNNEFGSCIEVRFDGADASLCYLRVSDDHPEWVDTSFSTLEESLGKIKNRNGWVRSQWFGFLIQLSGLAAGFILSLWAAAVITPRVPIENGFVIIFLFVLLLFSNVWSYLKGLISSAVEKGFPNIEFSRPNKNRFRWLIQAAVGAVVGALVLYLLHLIFQFVADELSKLFSNGV